MKLKSAVLLNALKVAYEQLQVRSAAVAPRLTLEAIQGEFVLFAEYFDNIDVYDGTGAIDELSFAFFRNVAGQDNAHLVDAAVRAFNKALSDQGIVTEEHRFDFFKEFVEITAVDDAYQMSFTTGFSDDYSASETYASLVGKPFSDAASIAESSVRGVGKGSFDAAAFSDTHSFHLDHVIRGRYVLGEYFAGDYVRDSESAIAIDVPALLTDKALSDTPALADLFTRQVAYARAFNDPVNATDDVDGSASILDDQEMQYVKFLTETSNITDDFARQVNYIREFANAGSAADTFDKVVAYVRAFSGADNTASTTDANHLAITKNEADAAHLADLRFNVVSKARSDTASTTDEGLILTQSYAGFYFSEDFVGSSTTF